MDGPGVLRCVLVPPTWEADRNDTSLEAARLYPNRFRVMGRLALQKPESRALMATWKTQPNMLGIRMAFNAGQTRQWLEDGTADWFWETAERYDVPVMAFAPAAVPKLGESAERHPALRGRCFWSAALFLGYRPFPSPLHVQASRDAIHRRNEISFIDRIRMDHGPGHSGMAPLGGAAVKRRANLCRSSIAI